MRDIDGDGTKNEAECCRHFKEHNRLDCDSAYAAQFAVPGNPGNNTAEDQRRNNHADEAQEDVAEEMGLCGEVRRVYAKLSTGQHGEEGPHQQRSAAESKRNKHAETAPPQRNAHLSTCMQKTHDKPCGEQQRRCDRECENCAAEGRRANTRWPAAPGWM